MPDSSSTLHLNLGGLLFSFIRKDGEPLTPPGVHYPQFLSPSKGDYHYTIHFEGLPPTPRGNLLFQGSTQWNLYSHNGSYLIEYLKPRNKRPRILCLFKKDFSEGEIYFEKEKQFGYIQPILQLLVANLLSRHEGIMVHSSGIVAGKDGFIFVGPSGAGKTTLANFWNGRKGVTVLNDEHLIIRKKENIFWLYGTPWNTVFGGCSSASAPLKKIFFISHAPKNILEKTSQPKAFYDLFSQLFLQYWDPGAVRRSMELCGSLLKGVPSFNLGFRNDQSVIPFLRKNGVAASQPEERRGAKIA